MKRIHIIWLFPVLMSASQYTFSQSVAADSAGIIVGAIRWDWTGGGDVNRAVELSLGPEQWHNRIPFFGRILNDSTVEASCSSQECVDREILFAKENGLSYWAFLLYPEGSDLDLPLRRYLGSGYNSELGFAVIGADSIDRIISYFRHPSYQTVLNGRPLYYIFGEADPGHISQLKTACLSEGIQEPYVVPMSETAVTGADAISRYWFNGMTSGGESSGAPYRTLAAAAVADWNQRKDEGKEQIPLVSAGTDGRPRIANTPPWIPDPSFYEKYFLPPSPSELAGNLQDAVNFVAANPGNCEAGAILVYAWNENDEGGWLIPTLDTANSTLIDESRLRAFKEVIRPTKPDDPRSDDASLKAILINGDTLAGFHPDTSLYRVRLPAGIQEVPEITALSKERYARVKVAPPPFMPGITNIFVSSENGTVQLSYTLEFILDYIPPDSIGWEFNHPYDTEGWNSVWSGHASISAGDSVLLINVTDDYPEIRSGDKLRINAATYDRVLIGLRNNTSSDDWYFKIYTPGGGEKFIDLVPGTLDSVFKEYSIDLGGIPEWQGTINQIGWLVARKVGQGSVEIDYIRLKLTGQVLSDDASLLAITVNGEPVVDFTPELDQYHLELPPGTFSMPLVGARATHPGARVNITQVSHMDDMAEVEVISQSGLVIKTYFLGFSIAEVPRAPFFHTDFQDSDLPLDWPGSVKGYTANIENQSMVLTIGKTAAKDAYVLGNLFISDFDLNPYVTLQYRATDTLRIAVAIIGESGIRSSSEIFVLPQSLEWAPYTLNLSALANEHWGYHLDSIELIFEPGSSDFTGVFSLNEIMVADTGDDLQFTLETDQAPELMVDLGPDTILGDGTEIILDAGNPGSLYLWSTGESSRTIRIDSAGSYHVVVSGTQNCSASDTIHIRAESANISESPGHGSDIIIYPNPGDGYFHIKADGFQNPGEISLSVSTISGLWVLSGIHPGSSGMEWILDLRGNPPGIYLLKINDGKQVAYSLLVIHP